MLKIREEQIAAFRALIAAEADVRLAEYARRRFEEEFAGQADEDVLEFVVRVRRKAEDHGVTSTDDVASAIDLTIMYGPNFYEDEWASDVFEVEEWDGERKMNIIRQRVRLVVPEF